MDEVNDYMLQQFEIKFQSAFDDLINYKLLPSEKTKAKQLLYDCLETYDTFIPQKNQLYDGYYSGMVTFQGSFLETVDAVGLFRDIMNLNFEAALVTAIKITFMNLLRPMMDDVTDILDTLKDGLKIEFNLDTEMNRQSLFIIIDEFFDGMEDGTDTLSTITTQKLETQNFQGALTKVSDMPLNRPTLTIDFEYMMQELIDVTVTEFKKSVDGIKGVLTDSI